MRSIERLRQENSDADFGILNGRELGLLSESLGSLGHTGLHGAEVSRVLKCPHCTRAIVERAEPFQSNKIQGDRAIRLIALLSMTGTEITRQPCNHHGAQEYDPSEHLEIDV